VRGRTHDGAASAPGETAEKIIIPQFRGGRWWQGGGHLRVAQPPCLLPERRVQYVRACAVLQPGSIKDEKVPRIDPLWGMRAKSWAPTEHERRTERTNGRQGTPKTVLLWLYTP